jgi:hypothetical protein
MSRADWTRDELILALDLYHRYGRLDDSRSEVVELSELLRKMAVHAAPPDPVRYRSPGSVPTSFQTSHLLTQEAGQVSRMAVDSIKLSGMSFPLTGRR